MHAHTFGRVGGKLVTSNMFHDVWREVFDSPMDTSTQSRMKDNHHCTSLQRPSSAISVDNHKSLTSFGMYREANVSLYT